MVTGASSGLGLAIACHLLKHNAAKIITLSSNEEHASMEIEQLKCWGDTGRVVWHKCDLQDLRQVDQTARKLKDKEKRIDAVRLRRIIKLSLLIMVFFSSSSMLELASTNMSSQRTV